MGNHEGLLALPIKVARLHGDATGEAKIAGQNSGLHLACSASVCGSGRPRTSQDLTGSITGGLSKCLEPLGGHFGNTRLLPGGDAISVDPAVSVDGEDSPQTNGNGREIHGNSSQQVAETEHVRVCGPEGAVSRDHTVDIEGKEAQGNDWVVPEGKGPANQVNDGDWDAEQAHQSEIENVRVAVGLGDLGEKPQKVLQRVPLLADALVKHG